MFLQITIFHSLISETQGGASNSKVYELMSNSKIHEIHFKKDSKLNYSTYDHKSVNTTQFTPY